MVKVFLFEREAFVRGDIIEFLEDYFDDLTLQVVETLSQLAEDIVSSCSPSITLLSATAQETTDFFNFAICNPKNVFVILSDQDRKALPIAHAISTVRLPFTSETLAEGIKGALPFLRSFH